LEQDYPILEFDPAPEAVIEPSRFITPIDISEHCVICFFQDVLNGLLSEGRLHKATARGSEMGEHPVYEMDVQGKRLAVFHPGVGAPLAAGLLDELIALGCRKFIACGGAGVLDREIACGHLVVPTSAVRDEGTSYHYLPPSREVQAHPEAVAALERTLQSRGFGYILAKTWTTDAIFRETSDKVKRRREEGCLTVEMEAAAFFAVAQFRGAVFGQILYGGDDCSGEWEHRDWHLQSSIREKLFWLAAEACLEL
jgi:uridine phosphorylase